MQNSNEPHPSRPDEVLSSFLYHSTIEGKGKGGQGKKSVPISTTKVPPKTTTLGIPMHVFPRPNVVISNGNAPVTITTASASSFGTVVASNPLATSTSASVSVTLPSQTPSSASITEQKEELLADILAQTKNGDMNSAAMTNALVRFNILSALESDNAKGKKRNLANSVQ